MFVTIRPNTIEHVVADCNCASSQKLCQHTLNGLPPSMLYSQNVSFINKTIDVKKIGMTTEKYRDNVISITAAIKSAGKVSGETVIKVKFNYPMLECV